MIYLSVISSMINLVGASLSSRIFLAFSSGYSPSGTGGGLINNSFAS